ncbi:hypothetical protein ACEN9D_10695 [Pseudomonas sp. CT11-2]|jgi:hypothetical protein|uniref:Uncharacterized protein n=2 Tax=Pseudomonas TaxID=286 RepID=A0ACC5MAW3_9PSED|nr:MULTISPECIES: hypothetical protein [Pseudomonas]ATE77327.1 hypothetical protein CNN82_13195 [Pseudomonas frederiksbergensis]MBB2885749.1 hypothetical protein [Pseudomonas umsongensis]NMN79789.1 hypothetical protein [Pseudomonas sp. KD5]UVM30653.1 hypothetical protein LOY36_15770 [Pseudomonas sp. B21-019]WLG47545.1 hypothetical protein PSH69_13415 [Pseudomonas sp. FP1740]
MSKDLEKTAYVFVDGDRHEAKVVRDSAGFQHGGIVRLTNGKIVSGRTGAAGINAEKTYGLIAAAVAKSGSGVMLDMDREGHKASTGTGWVMVGSNGSRLSAATCASVRIDEYATEMLKDPDKVREFFKRVNGETKAR